MILFIFSKIVGVILDPLHIMVALLLLTTISCFSSDARTVKVGRITSVCIALIFVLSIIFPVGQWMLAPLENKFVTMLPARVDGIILLTGDEDPITSEARGLPVGGHATQRYMYAARLLKQYPKAKLVIVGTTAPFSPRLQYTTKAISSQFLKDLKIPISHVIFETKSRNTKENAEFAKKLIKPKKNEKWLLLTSAFHLPRAVLCFEKVGWKTIPVAADYFTDGTPHFLSSFNLAHQMRLIRIARHEYVGLVSYWLMGWITRPW